MKKSDLKSGMILECENKYLFLVVLNHYIDDEPLLLGVDDNVDDFGNHNLCFNGEWMCLNDYNDDLVVCYDDDAYSIKNVYIPQSHIVNKLVAYKKIPIKTNDDTTQDEGVQEVTIKEIEEQLGYKIKIVG